MRTLLFTLEYPPFHGGVANYYGNLVKYWPEPENILVLNNNDGRLVDNKFPLLKWLQAYLALAAKIKQDKIEHTIVGQILPLGTASLICSWFHKTKYSVILHGMDLTYALKQPRKKWLSEKILKNAEKIICINNYVAEITRQIFSDFKQKIIVVNPGVENLATRNPRLAAQIKNKFNLNDKIILLSVGRLVKRKGFDKVIEAMPQILKQVPNLIYVLIGDGPEFENWKLKIENFGLLKSVYILNQLGDEMRNSWYNISDIFIMPSRNINGDFEGFGMVYLEANLAGKPVIAGKSGGVGDAVVDGLNGIMVEPEDIGQITSAIIKLAQNPTLSRKLGGQGRIRAIDEFNWAKQINKIYKFIAL